MNPKVVAQSQAFRIYGNLPNINPKLLTWQVGQSPARIFVRALSWLDRVTCARHWARALPREGTFAGADDVARARQLLLCVESNLDDHSLTMVVSPTASGQTWTRAARKQACSLLERGWYALEKIRVRERSRDILCRLSDRELADMGIDRNEIEACVGGTQRSCAISHAQLSEAEYELIALRPF